MFLWLPLGFLEEGKKCWEEVQVYQENGKDTNRSCVIKYCLLQSC